jgi:NAD(P)-dependent dehydrogenase (short-subunit alcohol dehydrogenase family)
MAVMVSDVDSAGLTALGEELRSHGATCLEVRTDVSKPEDVDALADRAFAELGGVHLLFNNAGVLTSGVLWDRPLGDWHWVLGVNLFGVIHGIRAFVPRMLEQAEPARVINTASVAGITASPMLGPYTVSKHAVVALTETLHLELSLSNSPVQASVLCPGAVDTGIMDSEGTRPDALPGAEHSEVERAMHGVLMDVTEKGMSPDELAARTFDAIAEDRFWILPHPDFADRAVERVGELAAGENPVFKAWTVE